MLIRTMSMLSVPPGTQPFESTRAEARQATETGLIG
jgi:hypothetical protein